jgi:hypothetical protein
MPAVGTNQERSGTTKDCPIWRGQVEQCQHQTTSALSLLHLPPQLPWWALLRHLGRSRGGARLCRCFRLPHELSSLLERRSCNRVVARAAHGAVKSGENITVSQIGNKPTGAPGQNRTWHHLTCPSPAIEAKAIQPLCPRPSSASGFSDSATPSVPVIRFMRLATLVASHTRDATRAAVFPSLHRPAPDVGPASECRTALQETMPASHSDGDPVSGSSRQSDSLYMNG